VTDKRTEASCFPHMYCSLCSSN